MSSSIANLSFYGPIEKRHHLSTFCRYLSLFFKKLLNFVTMRRLLTRVVNRVLLSELFTPAMGIEAQIHTPGRRRLVVGLGNPGMEGTRHNVGMAVLSERSPPGSAWPTVGVATSTSGKFGIQPEDILLVHDELDKPLGKFTVKYGGSARGHNGVRSCIDCLHTDVMLRLRVGIGRPTGKASVERHVLGRFSLEENKVLDSVLVQIVDLLLSQLSQQDLQSPSSPAGGKQAAQPSASTAESSAAAQS
ncbi:hypothetical protein L3Q82_023384 [Scortum barcoo]|uniref:Uncharacterized protein n=1 Tax=Scortum barcoo TaxID=214431 RepID=A0ACB8WYT5_9TELE|nr:hypothetical protein L3Q82_023384 [Scortum barcoo]